MSEDQAQEKTEEATPKRQQDIKKKGEVARSKEYNTTLVLISGAVGLIFFGPIFSMELLKLTNTLLTLDHKLVVSEQTPMMALIFMLKNMFVALSPFLLVIIFVTIFASTMVGGWSFSFEALAPKLERLDPIKGLQKIFSMKGLVELIKAVLKFTLVASISIVIMFLFFEDFIKLAYYNEELGIIKLLEYTSYLFLVISSTMLIITAIDVPFQLFEFQKKIKMTKQEVKDEMKETDGNPEMKSKRMRLQRELANKRMIHDVPEADVVITNPTHFAVAIQYKQGDMQAPVVVAKGADLIAQNIIKVAKDAKVPVVNLPPLARAIFYSTEIQEEIPSALYVSVAKVLAYIYQLKQYRKGKATKPHKPKDKDIDIPEELRR